jgi:hypothetical protein
LFHDFRQLQRRFQGKFYKAYYSFATDTSHQPKRYTLSRTGFQLRSQPFWVQHPDFHPTTARWQPPSSRNNVPEYENVDAFRQHTKPIIVKIDPVRIYKMQFCSCSNAFRMQMWLNRVGSSSCTDSNTPPETTFFDVASAHMTKGHSDVIIYIYIYIYIYTPAFSLLSLAL